MKRHSEFLRVAGIALLALFSALLIMYAVLMYMQHRNAPKKGEVTEAEKYAILAGLHSSSSADVNKKEATLDKLAPAASSTPTEQAKLDILKGLH